MHVEMEFEILEGEVVRGLFLRRVGERELELGKGGKVFAFRVVDGF